MNGKSSGRYRSLCLSGTSTERGRAYGLACRKEIDRTLSNYSQMFLAFSGISWEKAREKALRNLPFVESACPKVLEEMKGIAEGSGTDFRDIFTLNSRSEIVLEEQVDGCTAFAVSPALTGDRLLLCQNWDWIRRQEESLVVLEIDQAPEPSILMIAEAGLVSGKGLNSAGIGACFNALSTGSGQPGVPVHVILRRILDAPALGDAVEAVSGAVRAGSGNFLVGTREGEMLDIEAIPEDFGVLLPENGFLAHTNHFLAPNLLSRFRDHGKSLLPDTFHRLSRMSSLIRGAGGPVDLPLCRAFLSDHRNAPDSICRHEDPRDPAGKQLASVYSVVMDLEGGILWLSDSNPCSSEFFPYGFHGKREGA